MTWEWREGLRGFSYPLLFAFFYKIFNLLGLDSRTVLVIFHFLLLKFFDNSKTKCLVLVGLQLKWQADLFILSVNNVLYCQIKAPRLIQGFIAAYGDLQLYKLSSKLSGRATAQWTLLCNVSFFFIYPIFILHTLLIR